MKILYLDADSLGSPYGGGQARRTFEIARRVALHHEVTVLTAGHKTLRSETVEGVRYVRTTGLPVPANILWYFVEVVPRGLVDDADIIVESFSVPLTASLLQRLERRPVVGVANFLFADMMDRKYKLPFTRWERFVLARYRHIVVFSESQRGKLRERASQAEVTVIPNGVDERARLFRWTGKGGYVAFLGRLDVDQKGIDLLLEAVPHLPTGVVCRIAGDGRAKGWLKNEIRKRGLSARVELVGHISGDERHQFLANAALLAFPSRYEGQSLVLLDALAIGVPAVCFGIAANTEVVRGCAEVVPPFDVMRFAQSVARISINREEQRRLSTAALEASRRYDWSESARAEMQLYERLVQNFRPRSRAKHVPRASRKTCEGLRTPRGDRVNLDATRPGDAP